MKIHPTCTAEKSATCPVSKTKRTSAGSSETWISSVKSCRENLQHISFMAQRYRNVWILSCCILKQISTHRREIQWIITSMYLKQWMLSIHNLEIKQISKMNRWKQDSACALLRVHVQRCYRSLVISRPQLTNDKPGEMGDHATIRCSKWKPPVHSFVKPPRISSMLKRGILSLLHQEITKVTWVQGNLGPYFLWSSNNKTQLLASWEFFATLISFVPCNPVHPCHPYGCFLK